MEIKFDFTGLQRGTLNRRATPLKPPRVTSNREFQKLMPRTMIQTYPRKLESDKDKFNYLRELLIRNSLKPDVFVDLASVLPAIRKKWIKDALQEMNVKKLRFEKVI